MKQLVILSGKGGTGKTAVTAAFAHLTSRSGEEPGAVFADADVDAANLELLVGASILEEHEFSGGEVARIDPQLCVACGICEDVCRFGAVSFLEENGSFEIDPVGCEGCAACFYQCPERAIQMASRQAGQWFRSESRFGPLFHARLRPAQESSGKLVALVKERALEATADGGYPLMIVDGPPGIACPAIAAVTGADLVLIVTEPSMAGLHDLDRAQRMADHFRIPTAVCINKADLNPEGALEIEKRSTARGSRVLGSVPFDESVTRALVQGLPVTEYRPEAPASLALGGLWKEVRAALGEPSRENRLISL